MTRAQFRNLQVRDLIWYNYDQYIIDRKFSDSVLCRLVREMHLYYYDKIHHNNYRIGNNASGCYIHERNCEGYTLHRPNSKCRLEIVQEEL